MNTTTQPTMANWKRIVGQNVRRMTPEQAREALTAIHNEGVTIFHPTIRAITNGLNSQSVNHYVIQKLANRCGILRNWK